MSMRAGRNAKVRLASVLRRNNAVLLFAVSYGTTFGSGDATSLFSLQANRSRSASIAAIRPNSPKANDPMQRRQREIYISSVDIAGQHCIVDWCTRTHHTTERDWPHLERRIKIGERTNNLRLRIRREATAEVLLLAAFDIAAARGA